MDFNLYGMGFIRLSKALFRGALPVEACAAPHGWLHRECALDPAGMQSPPGAHSIPYDYVGTVSEVKINSRAVRYVLHAPAALMGV